MGEYIYVDRIRMERLAYNSEDFRNLFMEAGDLSKIIFEEGYRMDLDKLTVSLLNMISVDERMEDVIEGWYRPMCFFWDEFGMDIPEEEPVMDSSEFRGLPLTKRQLFYDIWDGIGKMYDIYPDERISKVPFFMDAMKMISSLEENRGKKVEDMVFSDYFMERFISGFENDVRLEEATEREIALVRRYADELSMRNSVPAMRVKAYACYGGNRLYGCDWMTSRDLLRKLYELTDDAGYANSLGYIAYYGRCTDEPDYSEAFMMFTAAHANGFYEATYKLADMYRYGYGPARKSPNTARNLYDSVYIETLGRFLHGEDTKFADAALRMGNVYRFGIGEKKDPFIAHRFYLQADMAIKRREQLGYIGDAKVRKGIEEGLLETRKELPEDFLDPDALVNLLYLMDSFISGRYAAEMSIRKNKKEEHVITIKRADGAEEVPGVLITLDRNAVSALTWKVKAKTQELIYRFADGKDRVVYDRIEYDEKDPSKAKLFLNGKNVGQIIGTGVSMVSFK
ncbi:MAG: sel1 repeat family protein [Clostridia bacterium]|nr:sel1 repeat family protein [Clostridia bacterium]